jgi:polyisoprenoid-binding protein YceI
MRHRLARATRSAALALGAALVACAAAAQARLQAAPSEIVFTSRQMGVPVDGRFRRFDADLAFDPKRPEQATVTLRVDLASAAFAAPEVESEIVRPEWFDARAHPQAVFRSQAVRATGENRYEVSGELTLKGARRPLVVPVTLARSDGATTASGRFTLRRLDFAVGDGEWRDTSLVADEVQVRFRLVFTGIVAP